MDRDWLGRGLQLLHTIWERHKERQRSTTVSLTFSAIYAFFSFLISPKIKACVCVCVCICICICIAFLLVCSLSLSLSLSLQRLRVSEYSWTELKKKKKKNEGDIDGSGLCLLCCWGGFEWIWAGFFWGLYSDRKAERGSAFFGGEW